MQNKMRSTVIKLKNDEYIQFVKVISYTKFGYNAQFMALKSSSNLMQTLNNSEPVSNNVNNQLNNNLIDNKKSKKSNFSTSKVNYYDVYAFSKSLLQINNLKNQIQQLIIRYSLLKSPLLQEIFQRIDSKDSDIFYIICPCYKYSLKQLIQLRQGLTEYQVVYFIMQIFQIFNYYKSREVYLEKVQLDNFYLKEDMKLSMTFNLFLNHMSNKPLVKRLPFRKQARNLNNCPDLFQNNLNSIISTINNKQNQIADNQNMKKLFKQAKNSMNLINSWNMGILIYQLFQNRKPFNINCQLLNTNINLNSNGKSNSLSHSNSVPNNLNKKLNNQQLYDLKFYQTQFIQAKSLIQKLLISDNKKRLNLPLIIIEPLFKKFQQIPHILPSTILTCPPSEEFKKKFNQKFTKNLKNNIIPLKQQIPQSISLGHSRNLSKKIKPTQNGNLGIQMKSLQKKTLLKAQSNKLLEQNLFQQSSANIGNNQKRKVIIKQKPKKKSNQQQQFSINQNQLQKTLQYQQISQKQIIQPKVFNVIYQTQKYIKASDRCLSENKIYIEQFVDISHVFGYGYQMNNGMLCFVFNDQTQFFYPNANRKVLVYINQKKQRITYSSQKLPQEDQLKKKIYILQGYSKTIKKYKTATSNDGTSNSYQKTVSVLKFARTKHACIFYLSNDSIQLFFNDKISFLMTKNILYILSKNNDKYQKYDFKNQTSDFKTRRTYVIAMAQKIFGWKKDKLLNEQSQELYQNNNPIKNNIIKTNTNKKKLYKNNENNDQTNFQKVLDGLENQHQENQFNLQNKKERHKQKKQNLLKQDQLIEIQEQVQTLQIDSKQNKNQKFQKRISSKKTSIKQAQNVHDFRKSKKNIIQKRKFSKEKSIIKIDVDSQNQDDEQNNNNHYNFS